MRRPFQRLSTSNASFALTVASTVIAGAKDSKTPWLLVSRC